MKIGTLIVGLLLLINGILILNKRRYGPQEGLRGTVITGKAAIFAGWILIAIAVMLIIAGLLAKGTVS